jgi:predicted nucleic acid-binding protein
LKLIFDTSVWVEHLRRGALERLLPTLRGKYQIWMDAVVLAELQAGCRSRRERRVIQALAAPFLRAGRVRAGSAAEVEDAGRALSKLREQGLTLKSAPGALLDAMIAIGSARVGALLVTENVRDFEKLSTAMPLRFVTLQKLSALSRE